MSESLWTKIEEVSNDNNTLDILKEQSYIISDQTKGKIKCFFGRIQYNIPDLSTVDKMLTKLTSKAVGTECVEEELKDKQDMSSFLNPDKGKYKFELYNDTFHYRLFTYTYSMFFPNTLDIDDGICEELNLSHSISINSNEELKNYLKDIFSSKSVRTALKMMMQ